MARLPQNRRDPRNRRNRRNQAVGGFPSVSSTASAPGILSAPLITSAIIGQALTGTAGSFSGNPTPVVTSRVYVNNINVGSFPGYVLEAEQYGLEAQIVSTAQNVFGDIEAASVAVQIGGIAPVVQSEAVITGTPGVGFSLNLGVGTATGVPEPVFTAQWQRRTTGGSGPWEDIFGASSDTYLQTIADSGKDVRCYVTWQNIAGMASSISNVIAVPQVEIPYAELIPPGPDYVAGVEIDVTIDWQDGTGTLYGALYNGDTQLGSRQSFTEVDDTTTLAFTPDAAGTEWNLRVYDAASGGTLVWQGADFIVLASAAAITISTVLASEYTTSAVVALSGTYAGAWSGTGTIQVYDSLDAPVGSATTITNVLNGAWGPTNITLPADEDTGYYVKAIHADTVTEDDSSAFDIVGAAAQEIASFTFEGTGAGADAIVLFGHAFEQGLVPTTAGVPNDDLVLRDTSDGVTLRRMQLNVLSLWPDDSVKTALIAAEMPDLADAATLTTNLLYGAAHGDPGSTLSFATELSGRSVSIKTWAPGNTTTPLWTYDPLADIGADRWHEGPLALSTRIEEPMPASANTEGRESVRLIVDVIVTKDGALEVDVCFSNDRLPYTSQDLTAGGYANCGPATFGYTIEIDGVTVYDQRPASGAGTTLLSRSQWIRRAGRRDGVTMNWFQNLRPIARPDLDALVASGVQTNYMRQRSIASQSVAGECDNLYDAWAAQASNPYWNGASSGAHALARQSGVAGGRPEIGDRPFYTAMYLREGHRKGFLVMQLAFEAASTRGIYWRDWEDGAWLYPPSWPRWSHGTQGGTSPLGTPKHLAISTTLQPTHNQTDHITVNHSHQGSFYVPPALLSGRRLAYDGVAARASWIVMDNNIRWAAGTPPFTTPDWRGTVTPNAGTGEAWGVMIDAGQTRSKSWDLRCLIDADIVLPDAWENRAHFTNHVNAYFNAYAAQKATVNAIFGEALGVPWFEGGASGRRSIIYQLNFQIPSFVRAQRCDVGGANRDAVIAEFVRGYVGWSAEPTFNYRNFMRGSSLARATENNATAATSWADVQTYTAAHSLLGDVPADWNSGSVGEADWSKNSIMGLANCVYALTLPTDVRALAADALVLVRSERICSETGAANRPPLEPQNYFSSNFQTQSAWPYEIISNERNVPPVIPAGIEFNMSADAQNGDIVGIVRPTGVLPRSSTFGWDGPNPWTIVSQPAGDPLSISRGGVLRVADAGELPTESFSVQVKCRTDDQRYHDDAPAATQESNTATITVTPVFIAPVVVPAGPFDIGSDAVEDALVATMAISAGTEPITWSIESGNTNSVFKIGAANGEIRVNLADISAFEDEFRDLVIRATGPSSLHDEETVRVNIAEPIAPVAFDGTAEEDVNEGAPIGTELEIPMTGDPATSFSIVSGNALGNWETALPNIVKNTAVIPASPAEYTLGLEASNPGNAGVPATRSLVINVLAASYALPLPAKILALYGLFRIRDAYDGPLVRLYNNSDGSGSHLDLYADPETGLLDLTGYSAFHGSARVYGAFVQQGIVGAGTVMTPGANGLPYFSDASGVPLLLGSEDRHCLYFSGGARLIETALDMQGNTERSNGGGTTDVDPISMVAACRREGSDTSRVIAALSTGAAASPANSGRMLRTGNPGTGATFTHSATNVGGVHYLPVDTFAVVSGRSQVADATTTGKEVASHGIGATANTHSTGVNAATFNATMAFMLGDRGDTSAPLTGSIGCAVACGLMDATERADLNAAIYEHFMGA